MAKSAPVVARVPLLVRAMLQTRAGIAGVKLSTYLAALIERHIDTEQALTGLAPTPTGAAAMDAETVRKVASAAGKASGAKRKAAADLRRARKNRRKKVLE